MQTFFVSPPIQAGKTWVEEYLSHEGKDTEAFNKALALLWSSKRQMGEIRGAVPPKNTSSTLTINQMEK